MASTSSASSSLSVGFVGLGNMGVPMVRCLAKAGFRVVGYDAEPARARMLAAESGQVTAAATLADVAAAPVIVTMLPDSRVVKQVVTGPGACLADHLAAGAIVVDMSSSFAPDTVALGRALAARGVALVDAPVSGGVGKAVSGTLAIMAGGAADDVARVEPVLAAMGTVYRAGALGAGHALKALNNYVSAAGLIATCEALLVGKAFGLDPTVAIDIINASTGRNNTTENKAARYLIPERYDSGFALALMKKDVGMAADLGAALGLEARELAFVRQYLEEAAAKLGPSADHTAVMAYAKSLGTKS